MTAALTGVGEANSCTNILPFFFHFAKSGYLPVRPPAADIQRTVSAGKPVNRISARWVNFEKNLTHPANTGCSLNIVFFKKSRILPFSVFPRCQCMYTHQTGRTTALQFVRNLFLYHDINTNDFCVSALILVALQNNSLIDVLWTKSIAYL